MDTMENCDDAQKKELEKYIAMPAGERDTKLTELKKAMADAEEEHNALLKTLQATFKESQATPAPAPVPAPLSATQP